MVAESQMAVEPPILQIEALERSFYGVQALRGVNLQVAPGRITGLIGPNGAGKTTLFNCITGVIPPDRGRILFNGQDIAGARPDQISRAGLVRTFQIARGLPRMSVLDNLMIYGGGQPGEGMFTALFGSPRARARELELRERAVAIAQRLNLRDVLRNFAAELSGGQKKLLEIGRALMADPRMILLDEPVAGVNPALAREIGQHLQALAAEGITVLLIEHHMDMIARLCDHVIVMAEGRHLAEGSFDQIAANPEVQTAYMGRRHAVAST